MLLHDFVVICAAWGSACSNCMQISPLARSSETSVVHVRTYRLGYVIILFPALKYGQRVYCKLVTFAET